MACISNLTPFQPGQSGNPNGRPVGTKSRATIARKVLEMNIIVPENMMEHIKTVFPDIEDRMSVEEIATIAMISNAITKGDVNSYKSVMDSAYGTPKEQVEHSGGIEQKVRKIGYGKRD